MRIPRKKQPIALSEGKRKRPSRDLWLVEKVAQVFWTNHRLLSTLTWKLLGLWTRNCMYTYSVGMFSAFVTMQHKICKTEQVSLQLASFPLQLVKHFVNETIHFACLVRCRLKSLDTMQSSARKFKTDKDEALWCRNWCRRSTQFSLDGWSNFFATKLAKFPFVLDLLFVVFEEVTRASNVVKATTCGRIIVALADGESLIAPNSKKIQSRKKYTVRVMCLVQEHNTTNRQRQKKTSRSAVK